ncbi:heparan-alpha-glucosaminide N-acetyltransferase domain-containing protein [Bacteroides fragilis]|nr:heparan-alpha-glucosaminide N-acetyltransferase domain-containing protein [Bacteroides fragilis]
MTHTQTITPKKRINSIDALRGFALIGIMLLHCMERFDLTLAPVVESPFWQAIDTAVYDSLYFLFSGKSYAMFSLLFGLSFFMQMESQAAKGVDFRGTLPLEACLIVPVWLYQRIGLYGRVFYGLCRIRSLLDSSL